MTGVKRAPRIAVTGMWSNQIHGLRFDGNAVATAVLRSVIRAGGEPHTLFAESHESPKQRLRGFDALLVPGGSDIDPARYGEKRHEHTSTADFAAQDQFEADMLRAAIELQLPVLAICRGFQLVNVEHGGTLEQDVAADSIHRNSVHGVEVEAESALAEALGVTSLEVSSYHHQAVARVGRGLRVTAVADDGVVEALEMENGASPLLAIQWHPEDTAANDPRQHALFQWLVDQAREHGAASGPSKLQPEPRILVIEHQHDAGLGHLGDRLLDLHLALEIVGPDRGRPVPDTLDGFDGLIVLGGSMGPTDDDRAPWLPATRELLASAVQRSVPTLGICLGSQLLATAAGGHVRVNPQGPEIGLQRIRLGESAANDPLFKQFDDQLPVVQWHWLEADVLPAGAEVLATSPGCKNQVFRIGDCAWGVQFHPEALGQAARDWGFSTEDDLESLGLDRKLVVNEVERAEPKLRHIWQQLADRFAELVEDHARTHSA